MCSLRYFIVWTSDFHSVLRAAEYVEFIEFIGNYCVSDVCTGSHFFLYSFCQLSWTCVAFVTAPNVWQLKPYNPVYIGTVFDIIQWNTFRGLKFSCVVY